MRNENKQIN